MGGAWEWQIHTFRSIPILRRDNGHVLNDESLRNSMADVECIVNSHPLTFLSSDARAFVPRTPNHILAMKSKVVIPPDDFQRDDIYLRKIWRRVQYLAKLFWTRWKKEYVQARTKWNTPKQIIEVGDIVIIKDDNTARNNWPLARVIKVIQDKKGFIRSATLKSSFFLL